MLRRRPVPRNAGAVSVLRRRVTRCSRGGGLALGGLAVLVAGCSGGTLEVAPASPPDRGEARACVSLSDALPDRLVGLERRPVTPPRRGTAAWGDPPIELRCGVGVPRGFDAIATCQITNGVAWFIPDEQITGKPEEITMTTIGRSPGVEVRLPADYFPPAAAMVQLAPALKQRTTLVSRCG
jgi:hypothetical protein